MRGLFYLRRGSLLVGKETLSMIISIVLILMLVFLVFKGHAAVTTETSVNQAIATLDKMIGGVNSLGAGQPMRDVLVESPKGWSFMSVENREWGVCGADFCLCLCEDSDCLGQRFCKPTEKFVLLKNSRGVDVRILNEEIPFNANLEYSNGLFYPFSEEDTFGSVSPLFFRFNSVSGEFGLWEWSPDAENWVGTSDLRVADGFWAGVEPSLRNKNLIIEFQTGLDEIDYGKELGIEDLDGSGDSEITNEDKKEILRVKGVEFLNMKGVSESEGVVVLRVDN